MSHVQHESVVRAGMHADGPDPDEDENFISPLASVSTPVEPTSLSSRDSSENLEGTSRLDIY